MSQTQACLEILRKQLDELMGKDRDGQMVESITVSAVLRLVTQ